MVVLENGRTLAQGATGDVLTQLALASHLHDEAGVIINGHVASREDQWHLAQIDFSGGKLWVKDSGAPIGSPVRLQLHARDISLSHSNHQDSSILNRVPVIVDDILQDTDQASCLVRLKAGNDILIARLTQKSAHHLSLQNNQPLWAQIKSVALIN